jgi:hypothetical protein
MRNISIKTWRLGMPPEATSECDVADLMSGTSRNRHASLVKTRLSIAVVAFIFQFQVERAIV